MSAVSATIHDDLPSDLPATQVAWYREIDVLAGIAIVVASGAIGVPIAVAPLQGWDVMVGPAWLFWAAFAGFMASLMCSTWLRHRVPERWRPAVALLPVATASVAVLTAASAGWTAILIVFAVALSAYDLPRRAVLGVLVWNTGVIAVAQAITGREPFEIWFTAGLYALLQGASVLGVLTEIRERETRRELAAAHAELRATSVLLSESSRATERLRIARELHDLVGHQLTALALELEVATHRATPPVSDHVLRARELAKDLLGDVRAAVGELRSVSATAGEALAAVVDGLPRPRVQLEIEDDPTLEDIQVTTLVRCAQEIVTNTVRHSEAERLWMVLRVDGAHVVLIGQDDGVGSPRLQPGNGLRGMQERVAELGGTVSVDGRKGMRVSVRLPLSVTAGHVAA